MRIKKMKCTEAGCTMKEQKYKKILKKILANEITWEYKRILKKRLKNEILEAQGNKEWKDIEIQKKIVHNLVIKG